MRQYLGNIFVFRQPVAIPLAWRAATRISTSPTVSAVGDETAGHHNLSSFQALLQIFEQRRRASASAIGSLKRFSPVGFCNAPRSFCSITGTKNLCDLPETSLAKDPPQVLERTDVKLVVQQFHAFRPETRQRGDLAQLAGQFTLQALQQLEFSGGGDLGDLAGEILADAGQLP